MRTRGRASSKGALLPFLAQRDPALVTGSIKRNPREAVLSAQSGAMREWCPRCGRKSLLRLPRRNEGGRAGYTCDNCGLGFIISEANEHRIKILDCPASQPRPQLVDRH